MALENSYPQSLQDDRLMKQLDLTLSSNLSERIDSNPNQCFVNAFHGVYQIEKALYIQGYLVSSKFYSFPVPHAWVEAEGKLIDPTYRYIRDCGELWYYAAQEFTTLELDNALEMSNYDLSLPICNQNPVEGWEDLLTFDSNYLIAYEAAISKCLSLEVQVLCKSS